MAYDPKDTKVCKLIDLNLFEGSSDTFRAAVGGYWYVREQDGVNLGIEFKEYKSEEPLFPYFTEIKSNPEMRTTVSNDVIVPNKRFPVRVFGSAETVSSDLYWKTLFLGGEYGGEIIDAIYNDNLYGYSYFESRLPYPKIDASVIQSGSAITDQIEISSDYSNYLRGYEGHVDTLDSELLIPNFYIISDLQSYKVAANSETGDIEVQTQDSQDAVGADCDSGTPCAGNAKCVDNKCQALTVPYDKDIINFVTREGEYTDVDSLLSYDFVEYPAKVWDEKLKTESNRAYTFLSTEYLPNSFIYSSLSASTQDAIKNKLQNIILDDAALNKLYNNDQISEHIDKFPFCTKINFPLDNSDEDTPIADSITENEHTTKFLKTLKEVFSGELQTVSPIETTAVMNTEYLSSAEDDSRDYDTTTNNNTNFRTADFVEMLAYSYNNYISVTDNCYYVGNKDIYRDCVFDSNGAYRYLNSVSSVGVMNDVINYMSNEANFDISSLGDLLYQQENPCHSETLAYRIQKVGGAPTGDAHTQNTLQNYWVFNSKELEEFDFADTQVKYGKDYTYHVYKYIAVVGAKYRFSDLRLTKAISTDNTVDNPLAPDGVSYGLEFYDPKTDEKASKLFSSEVTIQSDFATLVQERSPAPYLADFYLNYEPRVTIYEVPMYSKTLAVTDNPPNRTNVFPYQHMDDSQKIGFGLYYGAFGDKVFPKTISATEEKYKQDYMRAKDLLSNSILPPQLESISRPKFMEIYRIKKKPTAYSSFEEGLIATLDLAVQDSEETYTVDFFDDRIQTNQKYYYLFRTLNEHGDPGHLSEIYETELVNDGGYLYAVFNTMGEEDLEENIYTESSKNFKKIIQLLPNIAQTQFDTTDVDFDKRVNSQIGKVKVGTADSLIWDKTFKIRLTSKKTGKKIDLNITYKLN